MPETYTGLKADVERYLDRDDVSDDDFATLVKLTERRLWNLLRLQEMETETTLTALVAAQGEFTLPADFIEFVNIWHEGRNLEQKSVEQFRLEVERNDLTGNPQIYARFADTIKVYPYSTTEDIDLEVIYYAQWDAITAANPTGNRLDQLYDLYLWGALDEAMIRYGYDERDPVFARRFQERLVEHQVKSRRAKYSGSIQRSTPRGVGYWGY